METGNVLFIINTDVQTITLRVKGHTHRHTHTAAYQRTSDLEPKLCLLTWARSSCAANMTTCLRWLNRKTTRSRCGLWRPGEIWANSSGNVWMRPSNSVSAGFSVCVCYGRCHGEHPVRACALTSVSASRKTHLLYRVSVQQWILVKVTPRSGRPREDRRKLSPLSIPSTVTTSSKTLWRTRLMA